jgi:hypothetical protein
MSKLKNFESYWATVKPVYGSTESANAALRQEAASAWNAAIEGCAKIMEFKTPELLLLAGELTGNEIRTTQAVLANQARAIRAKATKEGRQA